MDCKKCRLQLETYLCDVPSRWREQIINVICNYLDNQEFPCIDILTCINDEMGTLDPKCLAPSQAAWDALSWTDKMQLIINKLCDILNLGVFYKSDSESVHLIGTATDGDPLIAYVKVSAATGNTVQTNSDGIFVPNTSSVETTNTETITLSGDGSPANHLTADVNISNDAGNTIESHTDGIYSAGIVDICDSIKNTFTDDKDQENAQPQTYNFLIDTCEVVSPPTGFAVTGNSRLSAFGSMEWFTTLTLANASAASGESVLIYNDTSENLTAKNGVNYFGIGRKSIVNLSCSSVSINISNILVTGTLTCTGSTYCEATNVTVLGASSIAGNSRWIGGTFLSDSTTLVIAGFAQVSRIYSEKRVGISESARLNDFNISYLDSTNQAALNISTTTSGTCTVSNGKVYAPSILSSSPGAIFGISLGSDANLTISNVVSETTEADAFYLQCGTEQNNSTLIASGLTGKSINKSGATFASSQALNGTVNISNVLVSNSAFYSTNSVGIISINGNLKGVKAYSENGTSAIQIGGSENPGFNLNVIDCIGEAKGGFGIALYRDVYITGGTYISRLNTSTGNPININSAAATIDPSGTRNYFISGVKTIAINTAALAIKGAAGVILRADGNSFLNTNLATNVPGIDPLITLRAVSIDAYGNRK